jgi:hypothetical protein
MHPFHRPEQLIDSVESLWETASGSALSRWLGGGLAAASVAVLGCGGLLFEKTWWLARRKPWIAAYDGRTALLMGVIWLAIAVYLHAHFEWSWRERFHGWAQLTKLMAALALLVGSLSLAVHFLLFT